MIKPNKKVQDQDLKKAVIANAVAASGYVLSIGDAIQPGATGHNKYVTGAASSGLILGVIVGLEYNGKIMEVDSVTGVNTASTASGALALNMHNDNETTKSWKVVYIPAYVDMEYIADLDATAGTTTDSDGAGFFNLLGVSSTKGTAGKLDESTIALFGGTAGQFSSYGLADGETAKVVGKINKAL